MFGSEIIEIAIGLVFVYLISSLVATTVREAIEGILKTRAIQIERGIRLMLDDETGAQYTRDLFDHPLINGLFVGQYDPGRLLPFRLPGRSEAGKRQPFFTSLPAYIPSGNFALALIHNVSGGGPLSMESFVHGVEALPDGRLKKAMLVAIGEAKGDLDRARKSVETWFDGTMDRVSGWYKRETSFILFAIGLVTAVALNVDSIGIARNLASHNMLRQQLVAHVDGFFANHPAPDPAPTKAELKREVTDLSDVIGWSGPTAAHRAKLEGRASNDVEIGKLAPADSVKWVDAKIGSWKEWWVYWRHDIPFILAGWVMSALAISLGAPFWFDLLNKLMVIRSTVKPYEKSPPEASADRGAAKKVDALAPADVGDAAAAPSAAAPARRASAASPSTATAATLRFAFDGADPGSVKVGLMTPVPESGFVELHLPIGPDCRIAALGTSNGRVVSWTDDRTVSLDDEQAPVDATLR